MLGRCALRVATEFNCASFLLNVNVAVPYSSVLLLPKVCVACDNERLHISGPASQPLRKDCSWTDLQKDRRQMAVESRRDESVPLFLLLRLIPRHLHIIVTLCSAAA